MASFTKLVCFFFLLTTLQTYARDSQFFSQVTRNRDYNTNPNPEHYTTTTTTTTNNNNNNNNQENQATPFSKQEEQPTFVPQTTQVGYGLYGHETGLDAPTTTTTTTAATTTNPSELYNMDNNQYENQNNNKYENFESNQEGEPEFEELSESSYTNNNINNDNINNNVVPRRYVGGNTYHNNNNFESNQEAEPEFEELSETSYTNTNNNNDNINNNVVPRRYIDGNNYNNNNKNGHGKYYGGVGYNGGVERQGMSDTRYLENGKYYYDINAEKLSNPTYNNYNNDLSYNNNFENNFNNNNDNDNNYKNNDNGIYPGYQSKFPKGEEFEFDDQP